MNQRKNGGVREMVAFPKTAAVGACVFVQAKKFPLCQNPNSMLFHVFSDMSEFPEDS
jgi:hypothetical protein